MSCISSGGFSGPVGSTEGGQPFRPGLTVTEEQPAFWGYTPDGGHIEIRTRGVVTPRAMLAFWLAGNELVAALERRLALKQRDGRMDLVLLVVAETKANRTFLDQHREQLRGLLPLDSRQVFEAFRRGELPDRSGIVIV